MERLAYQRMLFPNTAGASSSAASCPRPKQQSTKTSSAGPDDAHPSLKREKEGIKRAARQWNWLNGTKLSLGQNLAVGTWMVF